MIYYVLGKSLFLTNIDSDSRVVELSDDYKAMWEMLNDTPASSTKSNHKIKPSEQTLDFVSFLLLHKIMPTQQTRSTALALLTDRWGARPIHGHCRFEEAAEEVSVFGSYTEGYNGCEIESEWTESGPQPNHLRCK